MFHASLSCGNLLLSTSPSGTRGEGMTVMKMLREGRTLMAIATLMYAPVPLEEVKLIFIVLPALGIRNCVASFAIFSHISRC